MSYEYDGAGRLLEEKEVSGASVLQQINYTYDGSGNRLEMYITGDAVEEVYAAYEYSPRNDLQVEKRYSEDTITYTVYEYMANGTLCSKCIYEIEDEALHYYLGNCILGESYTCDYLGRIIEMRSGKGVMTYSYRPDGLRTEKMLYAEEWVDFGDDEWGWLTSDEVVVKHIWNGANISAELDEDNDVTTVYRYGNRRISATDGDGTKYYLYNAHGDVVQLTDDMGAVLWYYDYDAFGNEKNPDPND